MDKRELCGKTERKEKQIDKEGMRTNPLAKCYQKKKKKSRKKVSGIQKFLTASFYSNFSQRTEHLIKR